MSRKAERAEDAVAYLTECTLATVEWLSMRKKPPAHEYNRQIAIADIGLDFCKTFCTKHSGRIKTLLDRNLSVPEWAQEIRDKHQSKPEEGERKE